MSTFLKLALTALVLNGCFQAGRSAWTFYQFEDSVHQAVLFSQNQTAPQVRARILKIADQQQVPIDADTLDVTYQGTQARVVGEYTDRVKLVPGVYAYNWTHALNLDIRRNSY
jgi:hypothetical protein